MQTDMDYEVIEIRVNEHNELCCDYGTFENSQADPNLGIKPLVLVARRFLWEMLLDGDQNTGWGGTCGAQIHEHGRITVWMNHDGQQWVWELYEGRWWDGAECDVLVGKWRD